MIKNAYIRVVEKEYLQKELMRRTGFKYIIIIIQLLVMLHTAFAETRVLVGRVADSRSKRPVLGAKLELIPYGFRTYTNVDGEFRLPVADFADHLVISQFGFEADTVACRSDRDSLRISLMPLPPGEMPDPAMLPAARDIMHRAISNMPFNKSRVRTFTGDFYSKILLDVEGTVWAIFSGEGTSYDITDPKNILPEKYEQLFSYEAYSRIYRDNISGADHSQIIRKRVIADVRPQEYFRKLTELRDLYREELRFVNVDFVLPFRKDAFDFYDFRLLKLIPYGDRIIYQIEVSPKTTVFPTIAGTIKIIDSTFHLVEADVRPARSTRIAFMENLNLYLKYDEVSPGIWYPSFFEITAKANVELFSDLFDIESKIRATGCFTNAKVNSDLPDSIHAELPDEIDLSPPMDSVNKDFWDKNSLASFTSHEKQLYREIDSLGDWSEDPEERAPLKVKFYPDGEYNRVESLALGLKHKLTVGREFMLKAKGYYSLGLERPFGYVEAQKRLFKGEKFAIGLNASLYSEVALMTWEEVYKRILNSAFVILRHKDYYDYYRKDGFGIGINAGFYGIDLNLRGDFSRQFSLPKTTDWSLLGSGDWGDNPEVDQGNYRTAFLQMNIGDNDLFKLPYGIESYFELKAMTGIRDGAENPFYLASAKLMLSIPTFSTGYNPMRLDFLVHGGEGTTNTPPQHRFRMNTDLSIISSFGSFVSAPLKAYVSTDFNTYHLRYNLTDLWWRVLGLPLINRRGLDFVLAFSAGSFFSSEDLTYNPPISEYYAETGFSIARIPTFLSNVFYLSTDFRWGVGDIAAGRFGFSISVSWVF